MVFFSSLENHMLIENFEDSLKSSALDNSIHFSEFALLGPKSFLIFSFVYLFRVFDAKKKIKIKNKNKKKKILRLVSQ